MIDTHSHLYLDNFNIDREEVVRNAVEQGVTKILLPAIDKSTFKAMMSMTESFPDICLPMIGLHPTSVKDDYEKEMQLVEDKVEKGRFIAIGEIGIDLYWDKSHFDQQRDAFRRQLKLAKTHKLPVAIHTRDSFDEIFPILKEEMTEDLKGVFHCFTGSQNEAKKIQDVGFMMGIGGIITFKNSGLDEVVKTIPMEYLILETDSPFLTPTPFRGKRNQSAYLTYIASKLADVKNTNIEHLAEITTKNAIELFKLP